jgi:hypothetical protein
MVDGEVAGDAPAEGVADDRERAVEPEPFGHLQHEPSEGGPQVGAGPRRRAVGRPEPRQVYRVESEAVDGGQERSPEGAGEADSVDQEHVRAGADRGDGGLSPDRRHREPAVLGHDPVGRQGPVPG